MEYLQHLARIAYTVIGPIVVLIGAGYLVGRRVPAAADVLAKILLYVLIPTYVFLNIITSPLDLDSHGPLAYGVAVAFSSLMLGLLYGLARVVSRLRGHDRPLAGAFANTALLYNSANFAIPVMDLAFSFDESQRTYAVAVQVVVAACQGLAAYTVGSFVAAAGSGPVKHAAGKVLRFPFIYALLLALCLKVAGAGGETLQRANILWKPITLTAQAYVPVALMTLGAQMARVTLVRAPVDLALSMILRLVGGPLLGLGLVTVMGLRGLLGQVLIIGAAGPSAVASVVVAIEFKNRPDFASSAVFLSTLGAAFTVPIVIFLAQAFL